MPSDVGFQDSFMPTPYVYENSTISVNGQDVPTAGWLEENLMGMALNYMGQRAADRQPFLMYYPFFSVHAGWMTSDHAGPRFQRPAPPEYLDKYAALPIISCTAQLYAMLEYVDSQVGRLLAWLDASGLASNTYVMLSGDNGPALFGSEQGHLPKEVRMPSGMAGSKHEVKEGGIRNFLAVRGPGIPQCGTSGQLAGLVDVLPTLAELAGLGQDVALQPWDGISFANIIRGQPLTTIQRERLLVTMQTQCIEDDFIPQLGPDRHVLKPQPLLDYRQGGNSGLGFKRCIGVRDQDYKWLADARDTQGAGRSFPLGAVGAPVTTGLYRFHNNSHVEAACNEVSRAEPHMAARLEAAAASWFADMLASPHAFERPTFFLGLAGRPVANIVGDGAIARTPGRVQVLPVGVAGFVQPGDSAWYRIKVVTAGRYEVRLSYTARHSAAFRLWLGPYAKIQAGSAQHIDVTLDAAAQRSHQPAGCLLLPAAAQGAEWELRLQLTSNSQPGKPALAALDTIRFTLQGAAGVAAASSGRGYNPELQEGVHDWKVAHGYAT